MGGMAELSISTTDDDTCGDLCKYQCGNRQGSLVGLQMTAYTISEGGQRHQSLSLSLLTTDDDTCGDLCKYRCGKRQGSLVGLQITVYTISEGGQRHQSLSLSLLPSSVRHFQNHARKPLSRMVSASCRPSTKRPVVQKQCVSECRAKCKNTPAIKSNAKQRRYAHLGGQSPRRHYCLAMRLHASNGEVNIKASRQNHRNFPSPFHRHKLKQALDNAVVHMNSQALLPSICIGKYVAISA